MLSPLCGNTTLQCSSCEATLVDVNLNFLQRPKIRFVEFSPSAMTSYQFLNMILIEGSSATYRLKALIRNSGARFACAVLLENRFGIFYHDLCENCLILNSVQEFHNNFGLCWFFSVYINQGALGIPLNETV